MHKIKKPWKYQHVVDNTYMVVILGSAIAVGLAYTATLSLAHIAADKVRRRKKKKKKKWL